MASHQAASNRPPLETPLSSEPLSESWHGGHQAHWDTDSDLSKTGGSAAQRKSCCGIFPLALCGCLPLQLRAVIPNGLRVIQDATHLCLLMGMVSAFMLVFKALGSVIDIRSWNFELVGKDIFVIVSVVPSFLYLLRIIGTYDEQLQVKQDAVAAKKKELADSYEDLIWSIDDLLGKAQESSAIMAERGFESKRRDFVRFLERAEGRYSAMCTNQADASQMANQFRRFLKCWLLVFAECSVDPIYKPKTVLTSDELEKCRTVSELAKLTIERLKFTEVRFISSQRDQDAKLLNNYRSKHRRWTCDVSTVPVPSARTPAVSEIELSSWGTVPEDGILASSQVGPTRSRSGRQCCCQRLCGTHTCSWILFGRYGCRYYRSHDRSGYPWGCECFCWKAMVLSSDHFVIMLGWFLAILIFLWEIFDYISDNESSAVTQLCVMIYWGALLVLIVRFEEIDVIRKLEREVIELEKESASVQERRQEMVKFWNDMRQLTNLWVHRTGPRLDLHKEVQNHLEYCQRGDSLAFIAGANTRLEELEQRLPPLTCWRLDGGLSEASEKAFAERLLKLCHEENLPAVLHGLQQVIEDGLPQVSNTPPCVSAQLSTSFHKALANGSPPTTTTSFTKSLR